MFAGKVIASPDLVGTKQSHKIPPSAFPARLEGGAYSFSIKDVLPLERLCHNSSSRPNPAACPAKLQRRRKRDASRDPEWLDLQPLSWIPGLAQHRSARPE